MTGYRTLAVAVVIAIAGALQGLNWVDLMPNDPKAAGWLVTGLGVLMGALRSITTGPMGAGK